jgi:hypothetical protein
MNNQIVVVNVQQQVAAAPNQLQRTGIIISQGQTNLPAGSTVFIPAAGISQITAPITAPKFSARSFEKEVVNYLGVPTPIVHFVSDDLTSYFPGGTVPDLVINVSGFEIGHPAWDLQNQPTHYTGGGGLYYCVPNTPASNALPIGAVNPDPAGAFVQPIGLSVTINSTLVNQLSVFFAQANVAANSQGIYILELGAGTPAQGVTALIAYLANPTIRAYAYLVPDNWAEEPTFLTLANLYTAPTAQTYFWVSGLLADTSLFKGVKSIFQLVENTSAPSAERSILAPFEITLSYNPSTLEKLTPLQYSFTVGTTALVPSPTTLSTLQSNNSNWIGTGAEGGISNTLVQNGVFADGNPFSYWYATDWAQINIAQALANAVINGSNNVLNPLYFNQDGINSLQKVAQATVNRGISFGLFQGGAVVEAVSFKQYVADNPNDYAIGRYAGLSVTLTPLRGFSKIVFFLTVTNIATA